MELIRTQARYLASFEEMHNIISAGDAEKVFNIGDEILIEFEDYVVPYAVIGFDAEKTVDEKIEHTMTIWPTLAADDEAPFMPLPDADGRYNKWESSSLRKYLNSYEYYDHFLDMTEMLKYTCEVWKKNDDDRDTSDRFFILSVGEMDPETEGHYPYFSSEKKRIIEDENGWTTAHWTRGAYRGYAYYTWYVYSAGYVTGGYAANAARLCDMLICAKR